MNISAQTNVGQSARLGVEQTLTAEQRAIAATRSLEEQLIGNDLEQEFEEAGIAGELEEEVFDDIPRGESRQDGPGESLPAEDLSGHPIDFCDAEASQGPPEREDLGDSEYHLADGGGGSPFELEWKGTSRLVAELPRSARPVVRFAIDSEYNVCDLDLADDPQGNVRKAIASAVAKHLRCQVIHLTNPGDWVQIPAIGSDDELLRLVAGDEEAEKVAELIRLRKIARKRDSETKQEDEMALAEHIRTLSSEFREFYEKFRNRGANFKSMAIRFSNGDVVKVAALMDLARKGKRAMRAAALRLEKCESQILAGEAWGLSDWKGFKESQRKKKYKPKHA